MINHRLLSLNNTDEDFRALAYYYEKEAHRQFNDTNRNDFLQQALTTLAKIQELKPADRRLGALMSFKLGNANFNSKDFNMAIYFYIQGAEYLKSIKDLEDKDFRTLVNIFMNLSDAYSHLDPKEAAAQSFSTVDAAYQAFSKAILAFNQIGEKTADELKTIGNHVNDTNCKIFRDYFEKKLSTEKYYTSNSYKNNTEEIYQAQDEYQITKNIGNLSMQNNSANIVGVMQHLTVNPAGEIFSPLPAVDQSMNNLSSMMNSVSFNPNILFSAPSPFDAFFRKTGDQNIQLAQNHFVQGALSDAMKRYQEAEQAYSRIQRKNQSDEQMLSAIKGEIDKLAQSMKMTLK